MTIPAGGQFMILKALFGHWQRHKIQFITLITGLAAATALWTGVQALNSHARTSYAKAAAAVTETQRAAFEAPGGGLFDDAAFASLRRAGFNVVPILSGTLSTNGVSISLTGVDPLTFGGNKGGSFKVPSASAMTNFLIPPGILYTAPQSLESLERVLLQIEVARRPLVQSAQGIVEGTAIGDIAIVQRLLGRVGLLTRLLVPEGDTRTAGDLPAPWDRKLVRVEPAKTIDIAGLTESFHLNLSAFGLLCFLVGLFIVYSAVGLALEARIPSIRTLRVCGVSRRRLIALMAIELTLIATLAGLIGVIIGYGIATALLPDVAASLRGLYGAQLNDDLVLDATCWLGGVGISIVGALAAAFGSFLKVSRLPLLAAQGGDAWQASHAKGLLFKGFLAVVCFMASGMFYYLGTGLIAAFLLMASLLLGAAFILPVFLATCLLVGAHFSHEPMSQWFWADCRKQLSGLSLALMALLLALGTNIGVGSMVEGFRLTFTSFLDERLAAEVYVYAPDASTGVAIENWLSQHEHVTAVLPIWRASSRVNGMQVGVTGFQDHVSFRDTWHFLEASPTVWEDVKSGTSVLINEQLARRQGLIVGDSINLDVDTGLFTASIAGIYADYGNATGAVRATLDVLALYWPRAERRRLGVRVAKDTDKLITDLKTEFALSNSQVTNQATLKAYSNTVFEKTFTITSVLSTLTLGVAGIAMLTSLLTLANGRLLEIAPIWGMGVPRRTLSNLEFLKTLFLALLTAVAAVPLGIAVTWCLVAVVNVEAFGWRLPMYVFPMQWLQLVALGIGTAMLASIYPALKLIRTPPAQLAKVFANEH